MDIKEKGTNTPKSNLSTVRSLLNNKHVSLTIRNIEGSVDIFSFADYLKIKDVHKLFKFEDLYVNYKFLSNVSLISTQNWSYRGRSEKKALNFFAKETIADHLINHTISSMEIMEIESPPFEVTTGNKTYRVMRGEQNNDNDVDWDNFLLYADHNNDCYDFLDVGNFVVVFASTKNNFSHRRKTAEKVDFFVTQFLTFETYLVGYLLSAMPDVKKRFSVLNERNVKPILTRLEKTLKASKKYKAIKPLYKLYKENLTKEYQLSLKDMYIGKFIHGEVDLLKINDVLITKDAVNYETLSFNYPGLFNFVYASSASKLVNNPTFDIYNCYEHFCEKIALEATTEYSEAWKNLTPDERLTAPYENEVSFTVNGLTIEVKRGGKPSNYKRTINGVRINNEEIEGCLNRAICYTDVDKYNAFLTEVSSFSLKYRDILHNGIKVKIGTLPETDYQKTYSKTWPTLHFERKNKTFFLKIGENETQLLPVDIAKLYKKIKRINLRTNGNWVGSYWNSTRRSFAWAETELRQAIKDCVKNPEKVESETTGFSFYDNDGKMQLLTPEEYQAALTAREEAIRKLAQEAIIREQAAIAKSKELLESTIKKLNIKVLKNNEGYDMYEVKGQAKSYYVHGMDAKKPGSVYEKETNEYICIVDEDRTQGVGADHIVGRLYALKNDKRLAEVIHTLKKYVGDDTN